jgi:hypothetical protein
MGGADGENNESKEDVFEGPVCGGDIGAWCCVATECGCILLIFVLRYRGMHRQKLFRW